MAKAKTEEKKPSKSQLIREAMTENPKSPPSEVLEILKAKGHEVAIGLIYQVSQTMKKKGKKKAAKGKPGRKAAAVPSMNGSASIADDLAALRDIVKKVGAAEAKKLVDLFA